MQNVSIGALFLATKVEECPRKVRDVLNVFHYLEQKRAGVSTPAPLDIYSSVLTCPLLPEPLGFGACVTPQAPNAASAAFAHF